MSSLVPVTKDRHAGKRWRRYTSYAFAAKGNTAPLVGAEVGKAVVAFPIAFLRQGEQFVLAAVLGLEPSRNLYVADDGRWLGAYVPAAFRGYPFALARTTDGQHVLCVDESSGLVTDGPAGEPFFDDAGNVSSAVRDASNFLGAVEQNRAATAAACAALQALNLIEPWPIVLKGQNGETKLEGLFRVNGGALNGLPDDAFLRLRKPDALSIAYAQLYSMQNLPALGQLASARAQRAQEHAPQVQLGQDLDLSFLEGGGTIKLN